jgi:hypothetical protein
MSFLQTVQACGTSLVETVNHVLDFTKLSGNTKGGGTDTVITRSKWVPQIPIKYRFHSLTGFARVDLMQLVEEAVEGSWIGYQARMSALSDSEIGSVYAPPKQAALTRDQHVETVVDIDTRKGVRPVPFLCRRKQLMPNLILYQIRWCRAGLSSVRRAVSAGCS